MLISLKQVEVRWEDTIKETFWTFSVIKDVFYTSVL